MANREVMNISIPKAEINIECGVVFNYPTHTHSHYEMTLYRPFDGCIAVNGKAFEVDVPSAFLLSPSDFHRIAVNKETTDSRFIKIGFYEKAVTPFGQIIPDRPIILRNTDEHPALTELFNEMTRSTDDNNYLSVLIQAAMMYMIKHGQSVQPAEQGKRHELVVKVLRYANRNFCTDITLENTAKAFSVTPQYLSSVFTNEVGTGFSAYITDLRLKKASELLRVSDSNVTEICYDSGYRNLSHFLRSFKEKYGVTPKEYRKQNT